MSSQEKTRREVTDHQRQLDIINCGRGLKSMIERGLIEGGDIGQLIADLLGLSKPTVLKYWKNNPEEVATPQKKRKKKPTPRVSIEAIDDFDRGVVRRAIYGMYDRNEHVTLDTLLDVLRANQGPDTTSIFEGGRTTLYKLLHEIGFSWQKTSGRRVLMEDVNVAAKRIAFLREYRKLAAENNTFVFLDETWIFSKDIVPKSWQDGTKKTCKRRSPGDGKRFIVLHAGGREGFVEGAGLLFASGKSTGDYHGEMNGDNFETWMKEQLLPSLEEPSVIVMDNAPYHSVQVEKLPTKSWRKDEYAAWLTKHDIKFDPSAMKMELMSKALAHKPEKRYKIDEMVRECGHQVLRLPPYHCQYNPIELVWANCKGYYKKNTGRNNKFDDAAVRALWQEALARVTPESWSKNVDHTEKIINEDWAREMKMDASETQPFIIQIGDDESDSDEEEEEEEEVLAVPLLPD